MVKKSMQSPVFEPIQLPSLAVYIHWPFCKSKCPYCDFNSHVRDQVPYEQWKKALLWELDYMASFIPDRQVESIFFGGGTPSLMPVDIAEALIARVKTLWPSVEDMEVTLEANPTSFEAETFRAFKAAGINRVSLGVQSLRDESLSFLGREHSAKEALHAVTQAREVFERTSFDLIYGRPDQTVKQWEEELTEALPFIGGHLSAYQLTIEENTAFYHRHNKGEFSLPAEETAAELYRLTESILGDCGMLAYEVSNYAVPGQESRHNLAYWRGDDYVGVGPGAHGRLRIDGARTATQTIKSPERWLESSVHKKPALEAWQVIDAHQEAEERLMMGLRLSDGIDYALFEQQAGFSLLPYINQDKRDFYIRQGLLVDSDTRLQATLRGGLLLTQLTAELLL